MRERAQHLGGSLDVASTPGSGTEIVLSARGAKWKQKEKIMPTGVNGITHIYSSRSVSDLLARLLSLLEAKGITVFAVIDHSGEAIKVGMEMDDTKLILFGNPRAGTPIMNAAPDSALDLPLKILISEDSDGTKVSYNSVNYLQTRYEISSELIPGIAAIEQIAKAIAA